MIIGEFSDVFPPELDGVGAVVRAYAEELTRAGDECYYIAPYGVPAQPLACRTLLYRSVKVPREAYSFGLPAADPAFRRALDAIPFQLAHAHSPFTPVTPRCTSPAAAGFRWSGRSIPNITTIF